MKEPMMHPMKDSASGPARDTSATPVSITTLREQIATEQLVIDEMEASLVRLRIEARDLSYTVCGGLRYTRLVGSLGHAERASEVEHTIALLEGQLSTRRWHTAHLRDLLNELEGFEKGQADGSERTRATRFRWSMDHREPTGCDAFIVPPEDTRCRHCGERIRGGLRFCSRRCWHKYQAHARSRRRRRLRGQGD